MFKSALLFILLVGCESSTFEVENSIDTNESIANNVVFDDCGYVVGSHTCNFALLDDEGNEVNLYDFYGKTIVLNFSTIGCYYCQQAAYEISDTMELFKEDEIVYINLIVEGWSGNTPTQPELVEWINNFELDTPTLSAPRDEMIDVTSNDGFYISSWPTFFFIDNEMVMNSYMRGYNQEMINTAIANTL